VGSLAYRTHMRHLGQSMARPLVVRQGYIMRLGEEARRKAVSQASDCQIYHISLLVFTVLA
jgi:hypothetical protein